MNIAGVGPIRALICASVFAAFTASTGIQASPKSQSLTKDGIALLKAGDITSAAGFFAKAYKADRKDAQASFYLGVALNRLGQHGAALVAFQNMWNRGVTHRELGFEGGWAALARRQFGAAVKLLEPYVTKNPKKAKAHEFLGRAYIGTGQLDKAEASLNRALSLDPRLKQTVTYALGSIAALRGDNAGATQALNQVIQQAPNTPLGTILRSQAPRRPPPKPWFIAGSTSGGYNSNVIGLPEGTLLPADVSSKSSSFVNLELGGGYTWRADDATSVTTGYNMASAFYLDVDGFDSLSHTGYVSISHQTRPDLILGVRLSGTLQTSDAELAVRQYQFSPSFTYRWDGTNFTDVSYSFTDNDYAGGAFNTLLDRDSTAHTLSAVHTTQVTELKTNLRFGLFHSRNDAVGNDFDFQSTGGFAVARTRLPYDIVGSASVSQTVNTYDNLNSLAGAGFSFARRDRVTQLVAGVSRPLPIGDNRNVSAIARYVYNDTGSNIGFFDYVQHVYSIGVLARF